MTVWVLALHTSRSTVRIAAKGTGHEEKENEKEKIMRTYTFHTLVFSSFIALFLLPEAKW
jgi:hypothetical protein